MNAILGFTRICTLADKRFSISLEGFVDFDHLYSSILFF